MSVVVGKQPGMAYLGPTELPSPDWKNLAVLIRLYLHVDDIVTI